MTCPICDNKAPNCDCSDDAVRLHEKVERQAEHIRALEESLRDVLEISEVEGAVNLTAMESAKLAAARVLLGADHRFA